MLKREKANKEKGKRRVKEKNLLMKGEKILKYCSDWQR